MAYVGEHHFKRPQDADTLRTWLRANTDALAARLGTLKQEHQSVLGALAPDDQVARQQEEERYRKARDAAWEQNDLLRDAHSKEFERQCAEG